MIKKIKIKKKTHEKIKLNLFCFIIKAKKKSQLLLKDSSKKKFFSQKKFFFENLYLIAS